MSTTHRADRLAPKSSPRARTVERRGVLAGLITVGVAGGTGALLAGRALDSASASPGPSTSSASSSPPAPDSAAAPAESEGTTTGTALARVDQVPRGGGVVLPDQGVVLTRSTDDALRGFSAICTHQGCQVASVAEGTINCPCHGSRFDATTGAVVAGPAPAPLATVPIAVRGGDIVTA